MDKRAEKREPIEGWTERQRQVLDLIVKGRSNGEIADELGLSIDGVKWHMREILSKVGVESRTEAAEYWRKRNGLPSRFGRGWRAVFSGAVGKVAVAAVAAAGFAVAVAVVVSIRGGSHDDPANGLETPSATVQATATTSTTTPAATVPATPSAVVVDGREVPLTNARLLPDEPPRNVALVMTHGCASCDTPDFTIERIWWDDTGAESKDILFDAADRGGSYLTRIATSGEGSHMVVGLCVRAYCGPMGEYQDESRVQLWESFDYGSSWKVIGQVDGQLYPLGFVGDQLIVSKFVPSGDGFDHDLMNWETGERIVWPDWDTNSRPQPLVTQDGVLWVYSNGKVLDQEFHQADLHGLGEVVDFIADVPRSAGAVVWPSSAADGTSNGLVVSRLRDDGTIDDALRLPSHTYWRPGSVAGTLKLAGSMYWPDIGLLPTFVDLSTGEITRIRAPFEEIANANDRNTVLAAQTGINGVLARVETPGDCLNLRKAQSPTSDILTCIGDGALLAVLGADNVTALPVVFGPYYGHVSLDFVEFPATAR
ncbi:MAG: LuxR C-terminal-related transcriptional regulator [Dehalococcoidia bacterium]